MMNSSATAVLKIFRAPLRGEGAVHSPEELKLIASATRRMGLLPAYQEEIIHRAIELSHIVVREIMTPRANIFSLPSNMPIEEASARIVEEQHSRVPVYDPLRGPEHIVGIVHAKDMARLMHFRRMRVSPLSVEPPSIELKVLMHEVLFVPETKLAVDLLQEFQERRQQVAIVVDEFGTTVGMVTAEDALEQIVGEVEDEFDPIRNSVLFPSANSFTLDGSTSLRDLSTRLGWTFPKEAGVETLAGFLLSKLGHIPAEGEQVTEYGRTFRVEEMLGHRISRVRVDAVVDSEVDASATEDDGLEIPA